MQPTYTILGLGNPFYDRPAEVSEAFLKEHHLTKGITTATNNQQDVEKTWNGRNSNSNWQGFLGGSGANVIKTLAHLGAKCALYGKIGNDEIGKEIHQRLNAIGITSLLSSGEGGTGTVNCFITPDAERTMHTYLGVCTEFSENDVHNEYFKNVKHVHLEGYAVYFGKSLEKSLAFAQDNFATSSIDLASANIVEQFRDKFECVARIDFIFGNVQEMRALTQIQSITEALEDFDTNQTVVATDGGSGCWVKNKGESDAVHYKALNVKKVCDTTGAGDFYCGGFLYEALQGKKISQCVATGNLLASSVIQEIGADLPAKKWEELRDLVGKFSPL